jgi:1-acyl-sn-glycerol-3-phosphate acyltransferase
MSRPEITLENAPAVYDYYCKREPNPATAGFLHALFSLVYRPSVEYAQGAADKTANHLGEGKNLILAPNHVSVHDQFILAAIAGREWPLMELMGNSVILAKKPLFNRLLRPILDSFGAIPTIRSKDVAKAGGRDMPQEERSKLRHRAGNLLVETCVDKLDSGYNVAIFPENTRNTEQPEKVQKIYEGIGRIACGAERPEDLLILPIGMHFAEGENSFKPNVFIGQPFEVADSKTEVVSMTALSLQECVTSAVQMSQS